jgi:hypothetical protein
MSLECWLTLQLNVPMASGNATENQNTKCLYSELPESLGRLLCTYLPTLRADEVSWESWQLLNSIHDKGEGQMICE